MTDNAQMPTTASEQMTTSLTPAVAVDVLAQAIRVVDGNHDLGAGALAEQVIGELSRRGYAVVWQESPS